MSYQRIVLQAFGGPEQLQLMTEPALPEPGPGQVRVRVLTAGTGFTDTVIRAGQYPDVKDKPPFTPGYDWFGVVDALGEGVTGLAVGDPVADMSVIGGYTQSLCVDTDQVIPAPTGLDPAEAVCMLLSYGTAWQMLTRIRQLQAGQTVLVHAAGGAVGTALLELGRELGLTVIGTASSSKKELVESFGARHIDYRTESVEHRVRELAPEGVDAVFDTLGGRSWRQSYRLLKRGGLLVGFGALDMGNGRESLPGLMWGFAQLMLLWKLKPDGKQSVFYNIHRRRHQHPEEFKQDIQTLFGMLKDGRLKPAVAKRLPLAEAAEAHRQIEQAAVPGKIVLMCSSPE